MQDVRPGFLQHPPSIADSVNVEKLNSLSPILKAKLLDKVDMLNG